MPCELGMLCDITLNIQLAMNQFLPTDISYCRSWSKFALYACFSFPHRGLRAASAS